MAIQGFKQPNSHNNGDAIKAATKKIQLNRRVERDSQLIELTTLQAEMVKRPPLSALEAQMLANQVRTEHVWTSNALEGNQLTRSGVALILRSEGTIHQARVVDVFDVINLARAYDTMLDLAARPQPLTASIIRDLNRLATQKIDNPEAGNYRAVDAWSSGFEESPYTEPFSIRPQMNDLIDWSHAAQETLHPVLYAAELHRRFVTIHPFSDGNGRTARLLMNLALTEFGYPVINIQPDEASRNAYMEALHRSQTSGDATPFTRIIIEYVKATLEGRIKTLQLAEDNRTEAAKESNLPGLD